jgi:hypothetical protein
VLYFSEFFEEKLALIKVCAFLEVLPPGGIKHLPAGLWGIRRVDRDGANIVEPDRGNW